MLTDIHHKDRRSFGLLQVCPGQTLASQHIINVWRNEKFVLSTKSVGSTCPNLLANRKQIVLAECVPPSFFCSSGGRPLTGTDVEIMRLLARRLHFVPVFVPVGLTAEFEASAAAKNAKSPFLMVGVWHVPISAHTYVHESPRPASLRRETPRSRWAAAT